MSDDTPAPDASARSAAPAATASAPVESSVDALLSGGAGAPVEPTETEPAVAAAGIQLPELGGGAPRGGGQHFGLLLDVGVEVAAVVGTRELKLEQVLALQPGSIIDLDRHAGQPIELYVNGKPIALAEIVVVDGRLGARVVEPLTDLSTGAMR